MSRSFKIISVYIILTLSSLEVILAASCDTPATFRLGTLDPRFELSKEVAIKDIGAVTEAWNTALGKIVAKYDEKGRIPINFIFDTRQSETIERNIQEQEVKEETIVLKRQLENINKNKSDFEALKSSFENDANRFESELNAYNQKVNSLNISGGATFDIYQVLGEKRNNLSKFSEDLTKRQVTIQKMISSINADVEKYNKQVANLNNYVKKINKNSNKTFEQGVYIYDGKLAGTSRINIYQYQNSAILRRLLMHEMGHALGLLHVENEKSLMYYLNKGTSLELSKEDKAEYNRICPSK